MSLMLHGIKAVIYTMCTSPFKNSTYRREAEDSDNPSPDEVELQWREKVGYSLGI